MPTDETVNIPLPACASDAVKEQWNSRALTEQGVEARRRHGPVVKYAGPADAREYADPPGRARVEVMASEKTR